MTCIFPTKISPIEEGVGHATSSGWVVCHFVLLQWRKPIIFHNWVPQAAQLFNPVPSQIVFTQMTAQMQGRIWGEGAGSAHPPWDDRRFSNTTGILQKKNYVVYWCWSRARDEHPLLKKILDPPLKCGHILSIKTILYGHSYWLWQKWERAQGFVLKKLSERH